MHSVLFNMKRAYYRSLRVPRHALKEYGLTPARFDLLYALYKNAHHECFRADLVAVLGTVKSNVWRLCDAVEKLGFAKPDWEAWRIIKLTRAGIEVVERILFECGAMIDDLVQGIASAHARRAARPKDKPWNKQARFAAALTRVRAALDDKHLFDIYDDEYRERLWTLRIIPRAQKYFMRDT